MAGDSHRSKYGFGKYSPGIEAQLRRAVVETIAHDLATLYKEQSEPSPELRALLRKFEEREAES